MLPLASIVAPLIYIVLISSDHKNRIYHKSISERNKNTEGEKKRQRRDINDKKYFEKPLVESDLFQNDLHNLGQS